MPKQILYKYLDAQGAAGMLYNGNLQFTNATYLNDPFDCHPGLIDFSQLSPEQAKPWGREDTILLKSDPFRRDRERAWICSLSKVRDSILMWTFYAKDHTGVCIGLDIEKVKPYLCPELGIMVDNSCYEVQYRDIIDKPDYFKGQGSFYYQMLTKAKEWEYEQEVRMFILDPSPWIMRLPPEPKHKWRKGLADKLKKEEPKDWKGVRAYPDISDDCFDAVYLGVNILPRHRSRIIEIAKERNPAIKIYQMRINPNALRLDFIEMV